MARNRRENVTAFEAAAALEQVRLMIEVVHGKCKLLCWTYESEDLPMDVVRFMIWGGVEILYTSRRGSTLLSVKFVADICMSHRGDFSTLKHVGNELEVANKNYDVQWNSAERVFEISRFADEVTHVGTHANNRWVQPRRKESTAGLEFSI